MSGEPTPWSVEREELVFSAPPYVEVTKQHVLTDSGISIDDYYQVDIPDFSIACILTPTCEVVTIWQYKHGARRYGLTFPAGLIEPGEDPASAMKRELHEETGYECETVTTLGSYVCSSNQRAGCANLFLMEGAVKTAEPYHQDLETMDIRLMSIEEVDDAMWQGSMLGLPHVAVWASARLHLLARSGHFKKNED